MARLQDHDGVIFFNFRGDRGRELTKAILLPDFDSFDRGTQLQDLYYATLTQYEEGLPVHIAYATMEVREPLAKVLSDHGLRQYHTAETEKYAHVTFFFNGRREEPYPGEDRLLVPSPKVATYDLKPEMSAYELTDALVEHIRSGAYDFVVCNYANGDMVGHSGMLAAIKAVETVDTCLGRVVPTIREAGGLALITADHGNCEQLVDYATGAPHTYHTLNPVPFILVAPDGSPLQRAHLRLGGRLCDVTPTILDLMQLPLAPEMTCRSLLVR